MKKFNILKSIPSNLSMINVDTDMIIPKQFLKTIKRSGLGQSLFYEMRYDEKGKKIDDFILNIEPYNKSAILLTGKNFGCGSSREHAVWALLDFGIKCVISASFADIFYNNCFKNGVLPIILDQKNVNELIQYAERKEAIEINLSEQQIKFGNNKINFDIDSFKKRCLLEGLDDIDISLEKSKKISSYEENIMKKKPWLN
jgi:3-isopropylmalate/(R)-2-methylmalate dehydratase small subunit